MRALLTYMASLTAVLVPYLLLTNRPMSDVLTERQRRDITARLHTEVLVGQLMYNMPETYPPAVRFASMDAAALAHCHADAVRAGEPNWVLEVSEPLAARNYRDYLKYTIPHEAAHFILCAQGDPKWQEHGDRWASIVRELGTEPKEFHTYD